MLKKIILAGTAAAALGIATSASLAHGGKGGTLEARHAQMQLYQFYSTILGDMAKGSVDYDAEAASAAANGLMMAAKLDQTAFWPEGTEKGALDGSRAKPELFANMDDFMAKSDSMIKAAETLNAEAGQGLDAMRAALGAVGGNCGACHKAYRGRR